MVDFVRPTAAPVTRTTPARKPGGVNEPATSSGSVVSETAWDRVDRRKGRDRRRQLATKHPRFEMRERPRGRRRSDKPFKTIETQA